MCSWNIRSLLENSGDIRICRCHCTVTPGDSVGRKLDLLVDELARYGIETKWFRSDVWPAAKGYKLLYSGRPTTNVDVGVVSRGKGVGIVMDKRATAAWRAAGEEQRAVSSRLVMARLRWTQKSWQRSKESFLTIICDAPTTRAPAGVKSRCLRTVAGCIGWSAR